MDRKKEPHDAAQKSGLSLNILMLWDIRMENLQRKHYKILYIAQGLI